MAESKKPEVEKKGVEHLIKLGYKKVSAKTFISDIELEHFLNKDFSTVNKTRALGFIQILEREYDVDLSELRSAYLEYERTHMQKAPATLFVETPIRNEKEWQKYLPFAALFLVSLALLYYISSGDKNVDSRVIKELEENKSTILEAKKNIEKLEKAEENQTVLAPNSSTAETSVHAPVEASDDLDLDKVVQEMMAEHNLTSGVETNATPESNMTQALTPSLLPQTSQQETNATGQIKRVARGELVIEPIQKSWVGVIYLDTFEKSDVLIRDRMVLDSSRDQLIMIGHNQFQIFNNSYSFKFKGKGPVRFIFKDGDLMEISKKEFDQTSAGVAW